MSEIEEHSNASALPGLDSSIDQCVKDLKKNNEMFPQSTALHREMCRYDSNLRSDGHQTNFSRGTLLFCLFSFFLLSFFFAYVFYFAPILIRDVVSFIQNLNW